MLLSPPPPPLSLPISAVFKDSDSRPPKKMNQTEIVAPGMKGMDDDDGKKDGRFTPWDACLVKVNDKF